MHHQFIHTIKRNAPIAHQDLQQRLARRHLTWSQVYTHPGLLFDLFHTLGIIITLHQQRTGPDTIIKFHLTFLHHTIDTLTSNSIYQTEAQANWQAIKYACLLYNEILEEKRTTLATKHQKQQQS